MSASLFVVGWLTALVAVPTLALLWQRFWVGHCWRRAARPLGLCATPHWFDMPTIEGASGDVSVLVKGRSGASPGLPKRMDWRFEVRHRAAPSLSIRSRGLSEKEALRTGDDRLDWSVMTEGEEVEAIARFNRETREALRSSISSSV